MREIKARCIEKKSCREMKFSDRPSAFGLACVRCGFDQGLVIEASSSWMP